MVKHFLQNFVVFSDEGKEELQALDTYVVGCRRRPKYVDGKPLNGEYDGSTLTIQVDRGQEYANEQFDLIVSQEYDENDILDKDVNVCVDDAKIYARSYKGSTYAELKVSLHGHIELLNGSKTSENESEGVYSDDIR